MAWLIVIILGVVVYIALSSKTKPQSNSGKPSRTSKSSIDLGGDRFKAVNFNEPIPTDHQIYNAHLEVAGLYFQKDKAIQFVKGSNQTLELERDSGNEHDKNAIKVIGIASSSRYFLGYVPKEVSEHIVKSDLFSCIKPRLMRIYLTNDGYMEIQFQIVGLKEHKKQYDDYLNNQPADTSQKEFYKFLGLPVPSGLTSLEANEAIAKARKNPELESKLTEYYAYQNILTEFEDSDFREAYEIKKVSKTILNEALNQLRQEGKTFEHLSDNIDDVVDRVIQLKPELMKA